MRKITYRCKYFLLNLSLVTLFLSGGCASEQTSILTDENYKIATPDYIVLAEKSLDLWVVQLNTYKTF